MSRKNPEEFLAGLRERGQSSTAARAALAALALAEGGFRAAVAARGLLYSAGLARRVRLPRPVVSVGNIEAGGTGKTPLVRLLARLLSGAGLRPAVVSRGYLGAAAGPVNVVSDGKSVLLSAAEAGDEPYLLARALPGVPVLTGKRRAQPALAAIERFGAEVIVLDDGFQHLSLARDLDLVVVTGALADSPRLLPRGLLREPLSALARASALVMTNPEGDALAGLLAARFPALPRFKARHVPEGLRRLDGAEALAPRELAGRRVVAFCGLGGPRRFRRTLEALGADVAGFHAFPDHHRYAREELEALRLLAGRQRALLVTTEKDAVRLPEGAAAAEVWALSVRLEVEDEGGLASLVLAACGGAGGR